MGNNLRHVYAFRLSDGDEQKLAWLLTRFHIESRRRKSSTFRCLVRELYGLLKGMDFQARMPARAAAQVEMAIEMQATDLDEEVDDYMESEGENPSGDPNYSRLRGQAIEELKMDGRCCDLMSVRAAVGELLIREKKKGFLP